MAPHRVAAGALVSSLLRLRNGSRVLQPLERALGGLRVRPLTSGTPYNAVTVGVPKETFPGERRVAITPNSVALLKKVR
jgi:NAD(P) transhydrogenase